MVGDCPSLPGILGVLRLYRHRVVDGLEVRLLGRGLLGNQRIFHLHDPFHAAELLFHGPLHRRPEAVLDLAAVDGLAGLALGHHQGLPIQLIGRLGHTSPRLGLHQIHQIIQHCTVPSGGGDLVIPAQQLTQIDRAAGQEVFPAHRSRGLSRKSPAISHLLRGDGPQLILIGYGPYDLKSSIFFCSSLCPAHPQVLWKALFFPYFCSFTPVGPDSERPRAAGGDVPLPVRPLPARSVSMYQAPLSHTLNKAAGMKARAHRADRRCSSAEIDRFMVDSADIIIASASPPYNYRTVTVR